MELSQKRAEEAIVATLKTQVSKIDSFTKKIDSAVWASNSQIKELAYEFRQLLQRIKHLDNL